MAGIGVQIEYDPQGNPMMVLTVDSGMTMTRIWLADKNTAQHNIAEITRQLQAAKMELMKTPVKLMEVKGNLDGLRTPSRGVTPGRSQGSTT